MRSGTCEGGLRYAVRRNSSAVAYCSLSIGRGTSDEGNFPEGIAHFVEHTIFRGTATKSAAVISCYLDKLGGELNAYTTKEEIVLHATTLKEDLWKAVGLLFELATQPTFPVDEIETERTVVLDEIISYKDNPAEDVYDNFESLLFEGHPLGRRILGTTASVKRITADDLHRFVAENFLPGNMALSIVANIDEAVLEKRVQNFFDSRSRTKLFDDIFLARKVLVREDRKSFAPSQPFNKTVDKHNHEVNAVIGSTAPSLYEMPDRLVAAMLVNILGGPASNSLLNKELREKHGWVYSVECSYTQYRDTGIAAITFGCDKPHLDCCLKAIHRILTSLREVPLSERRLQAYRKQLFGQIAISSDNGEAQCLSMGKSLLAWNRVPSNEEIRKTLEAVTPDDLLKMSRRIFAADKLSTLIYL
ncbi:MAG: insulinase family protein [Bacteroidales bacterium]|nr:insulinase family protein [Bacteroidales bacterium]